MNKMNSLDKRIVTERTERLLLYACIIHNEYSPIILSGLEDYHFTHDDYKKIFKVVRTLYERGLDVKAIAIDKIIKEGVDRDSIVHILDDEFSVTFEASNESAIQKSIRFLKEEYIKNNFMYNGAESMAELQQLLTLEFENKNTVISTSNIDALVTDMIAKNIETIPLPFTRLNKMLGGIKKHEYTIVGARPSVGKSAFLEQVFWHATSLGKKALFVSLEMGEDAIFKRQILRMAGVNLFSDFVSMEQKQQLFSKVKEALGNSVIAVGTFSTLEIDQLIKQHEPDVVLVDYLQLIPVSNTRWSDYERTTAVTKALAHLRTKYNTALVVASQYARIKSVQPQLSDLRSSGQIEQDADLVLSLWRNGNGDFEDESYKKIAIDCLKNRNGVTFTNSDTFDVSLAFQANRMSFVDDK